MCSGGTYVAPKFYITPTATNYYFAGRLVKNGNTNNWVYADRLGSVGRYYPYGQDKGSSNPTSGDKFAGQYQDSETGLNYADQRYYAPGSGRFMTADRAGHPQATDPGTWNRYAYVGGDPINRTDRHGTDCDPGIACFYVTNEPDPPPSTEITDLEESGGNPCSGQQGDDPDDLSQDCDNFLIFGGFIQVGQPMAPQVLPENGLQGSTNPALDNPGNLAYTKAMTALGVSLALTALQNPECASLFGEGIAGTPDPALFLSAMWNAGSFAFGFEADTLGANNQITGWTNAWTAPSGCASYQPVPANCNSATITINTNASTPDNYAGSAQDFAITILHELGECPTFR